MERKWISNRIERCQLCLSTKRNLYSVEYLRGPYQLITGFTLERKEIGEKRVCWECRAVLDRILRFRRQARHALQVLSGARCSVTTQITSLSSLVQSKTYNICINEAVATRTRKANLIISRVVTHQYTDKCMYDSLPVSPNGHDLKTEHSDEDCVENDPIFMDDQEDSESPATMRVEEFIGSDADVKEERTYAAKSSAYKQAAFKCMSCLIGMPTMQLFKQHIKTSHAQSIGDNICAVCQSRFSKREELTQHMNQHKRLFRCSGGDYLARSREDVLRHIESEHNSGDKEIKQEEKCDDLKKMDPLAINESFNLTDQVSTRKITREELRNILEEKRNDPEYKNADFKCDSCYLGFQSEKSFKNHNDRFQHKKMPDEYFKCETCANSFELASALRMHARSHDTLYECKFGDFTSLCPQNMYSHLRASHKRKQTRKAKEKMSKKRRTSGESLAQIKSKLAKAKEKSKTESPEGIKKEKQVLLKKMLRDNKCETFRPTDEEVMNMKALFRFKSSRKSCDDCCVYFGTDERIFEHRKLHAEAAGAHMCDICKLRFTTADEVTDHRASHYVWYRCKMEPDSCRYITHMRKPMALHIYKLHKPKSEQAIEASKKTYECDVCKKVFTSSRGILNHTRRHDKQHICDYCGLLFSGYSELVHHIKQRHQGARSTARSYPEGVHRPRLSDGRHGERHRNYDGDSAEKQFVCEFCSKRFKNMSLLKYHRNQHYNLKPYSCKLCEAKFCDPNRRSMHVAKVHLGKTSETFRCSICREEFPSKFKYNRHLLTHEEQRHYKCEQCPKAFFTYNTLVNHQVVHTSEQKLECEVCCKKFTFLAHLNSHINRSHRARDCDMCGKQFECAKSWKDHVKTHRVFSEESSLTTN